MEEIKVTWRFAWALWWRWLVIGLGFTVIIWLITFLAVGAAILPLLRDFRP